MPTPDLTVATGSNSVKPASGKLRPQQEDGFESRHLDNRTGPGIDPGDSEIVAWKNFAGAGQQDSGGLRRDYRTGALTAAIIALSVLLGWMVGRSGWNLAVNRAQIQTPQVSENVAQVSLDPVAKSPSADEPIEGTQPTGPALRALSPPKPAPKSNRQAAEPNSGLMMFEHDKVIFRAAPSETKMQTEGKGNSDSQTASDQVASPAASNYLVSRVVPEYPEQARQQHVQGPVVLNALVGKGGSVQEVKVISGEPELAEAAVEAVKQWRFQPQKLEGNPVEFETRITVNFSLP
jgi:TonB family protein